MKTAVKNEIKSPLASYRSHCLDNLWDEGRAAMCEFILHHCMIVGLDRGISEAAFCRMAFNSTVSLISFNLYLSPRI